MESRVEKIDFPGIVEISFAKLYEDLKTEAQQSNAVRKNYIDELIKTIESRPELRSGISLERTEEFKSEIDTLMTYLFPPALTNNEIKVASAAWESAPFYTSKRTQNLLDNATEDFTWAFEGFDHDQIYVSACSAILSMHYGYKTMSARPYFIKLKDKKTEVTKHYRMAFNVDFISIEPTERARAITQDDYHQLIDNYHDIDLWKKMFPPRSWKFSGFNLVNMLDLSMDWNIKQIEEDLLNGGPNAMRNLQRHIADLIGVPDLEVSFVSLEGEGLLKTLEDSHQSIMLGHEESIECEQLFCSNLFKAIVEDHEPLGIPNIDRFRQQSPSALGDNIKKRGFKSYFVAPVVYRQECIGLLELGSKQKGALTASTQILLHEVLPELGAAGHRFQQERLNRIEAIIQEEFTSIHPSVKWRFVQEAEAQIRAEENGGRHLFDDPVFKEVYPLYGQLDIRGSSNIRHQAIRTDLMTQLTSADLFLRMIRKEVDIPVLEEIHTKIQKFWVELESDKNVVIERKILPFMDEEVEPILKKVQKDYPIIKNKISDYLFAVHDEFNILHAEHRKFNESVNSLNSLLASQIDKEQERAQAMFPHYFERYKTDGIEFNMFIGSSISPNDEFDYSMVKSLRVWQLMLMVELEWKYAKFRDSLEKPLDIASLILAYGEAISIHFRMDEKRFDVAGAYNARYELLKKRIDKSHIKGTKERITKPGTIVVIYTNQGIENEYLRYIELLQEKGYLEVEQPELLDVEDLPGVHGLKAIRIGIRYPASIKETELPFMEVMKSL